MLIQLDEKYRIYTDQYNYVLEQYQDVKDRKTKEIVGQDWKIVGYFGTNLSAAIKRYASEVIKDTDDLVIDSLLDKLNELNKHIDKVVKKESIDFTFSRKASKDDE